MANHKKSKFAKDVVGQKFGRLLIVSEIPKEERRNPGKREVMCLCDCGNEKRVSLNNLRYGNTTSCGCFEKENIRKRRKHNIVGERFGRLIVVGEIEPIKNTRQFMCKCDCGNEKVVRIPDLLLGRTRSCGCLRKEISKERMSEDLTGQIFNELTAIRQVDDFVGRGNYRRSKWLFRCSCGREVEALAVNVKHGKTKSCGHFGRSIAEHLMFKWLSERNVRFDYEAMFNDLRNPSTGYMLHFDFRIYRNDGSFFLVEHQGEQHFNDKSWYFGREQREKTDKIKKNYCATHGITLYETFYDEDYMAQFEKIVSSELNKECDAYEGVGC